MSEYYVFYRGTRLVVEAGSEADAIEKGIEYLGATRPETVQAHLVETFEYFRVLARQRAAAALEFAGT